MKKLSHIDNKGKANMVDVCEKPDQIRIAEAEGFISLQKATIQQIIDNQNKYELNSTFHNNHFIYPFLTNIAIFLKALTKILLCFLN